jgi:hypothetical protein
MCGPSEGQEHHVKGLRSRSYQGLAVAVQMRPHDAQDGDDEQDGEGHIRADEDGGEDSGHDVEGGR